MNIATERLPASVWPLLGRVAAWSAKMAPLRVNFVPANWLLVGVSAFVAFWMLLALLNGFWLVLPLFLLALAVAVPLGFVAFNHNIVFVPGAAASDAVATNSAQGGALAVRFWGNLALDVSRSERFFDVPALLAKRDEPPLVGSLAFSSRIRFDSRVFGVSTGATEGEWLCAPRAQTLEIESGALFWGEENLPALRLRFISDLNGKRETACVAFETAAVRDAVAKRLAKNLGGS